MVTKKSTTKEKKSAKPSGITKEKAVRAKVLDGTEEESKKVTKEAAESLSLEKEGIIGEGEVVPKVEKYYESVGRRKEATARVRLFTKKSTDIQPSEEKAIISVNDMPYFEYFRYPALYESVDAPLRKLKSLNRFKATVRVHGGGMRGQAEAARHGLTRALILFDINFAKKLKKAGYLTRDPREKERRKYGLKKARKSPQWSKR